MSSISKGTCRPLWGLVIGIVVLSGSGAPIARADASASIEDGWAAVRRDDHAGAVEAFRRAVSEDPALRDSVAVPLASQLTWAGRYDEAISEFGRFLESHPHRKDALLTLALAQSWSGRTDDALDTYRRVLAFAPQDRDAAFGEARMYAWKGCLGRSVRAYDALLAREPDFVDAQLGQAQAVNWEGDNRRAASLYGTILREHPGTAAAHEGRAAAWNWAGRPDRALDDLVAAATISGSPSRGASDLERSIRGDWRPSASLVSDLSRDSDRYRLLATRLEIEMPVDFRARIRPFFVRERSEKPRRPTIEDTWAGVGGEWRINDPFLLYGSVRSLVDRSGGTNPKVGSGDGHLAWIPGDRVRVDAGYGRAEFFTYERSVDGRPQFVGADIYDAGVSVRPWWRTTFLVGGDRGFFTDGNRRTNLRARVRYALPLSRPRAWIEIGTQWLDYKEDIGGGLWTPRDFRALLIAPEVEWTLTRPAIVLFGRCDAGFARDRFSKTNPYLTIGAGARYDLGVIRIEGRAGHADSNLDTGRGYSRDYGSLSARVGL